MVFKSGAVPAFLLHKKRCAMKEENKVTLQYPLRGRKRILTNVREIDAENIGDILSKAYSAHQKVATEIEYLLQYKAGSQDLKRIKDIRPEIDIHDVDNLADYITWFHTAFFWSVAPTLVQRSDIDMHETDAKSDDAGINAMNEMLMNGEGLGRKDITLAEYVETCGIGHRMVDIKTADEFADDEPLKNKYGKFVGSLVHVYPLDSRYAFCVYYNGPGRKKLMGVTFAKTDAGNVFTCFTDKSRFDISGEFGDGLRVVESPNLLKMIPIFEYERAEDRSGCFEKQIDALDALNTVNSDFDNDMAQNVQQIWWGNDVDFTDPETGKESRPQSNDWVLTHSGASKNPKIQPLASTLDRTAALSVIKEKRSTILNNARVPIQYEQEGGGSTGVAMSMSTGWSAAQIDADLKEAMVKDTRREELKCIIRAISFVPESVLPIDSDIRNVHEADVDFHFFRNQNYDLTTKMNAFATGLKSGIHGRHLLNMIKAFPDNEAVWMDSREMIESYQKSVCKPETSTESNQEVDNERTIQDISDQRENSVLLDFAR